MLTMQRALGAGGPRSSPPHVGCHPPLSMLQTSPRKPPPTLLLLPPFGAASSLLCSTTAAASHVIARYRRAASELSDGTKRSAPSPRPSCTKSLPATPDSEARHWDSFAVIFLREHLTDGSLLWFSPHPANPDACFTPPRSSSPNTSPTASTTPSAPHWCLLPIIAHATVEAPPPVSTPLLGFLVAACRSMSCD
jgi:hypothetical protein